MFSLMQQIPQWTHEEMHPQRGAKEATWTCYVLFKGDRLQKSKVVGNGAQV